MPSDAGPSRRSRSIQQRMIATWILFTSSDRDFERDRGLVFFPGMHLFCDRRYQVKGRIDRLIMDGTGEMREVKNTVLLEGATCRCSYLRFGLGGCSRCEFAYWRDPITLRLTKLAFCHVRSFGYVRRGRVNLK